MRKVDMKFFSKHKGELVIFSRWVWHAPLCSFICPLQEDVVDLFYRDIFVIYHIDLSMRVMVVISLG